jgi:HEAT repeat protein
MSKSIQQAIASAREEDRLGGLRRLREVDLSIPMPLLAEAMGDTSWRVRKEAVRCFLQGAHRHWQVSDAIALLNSEDNAGLRNAATEVLIQLGPSAVEALKAEMATADQDVRKFILDIMGEIGDEVCIGALIEALSDADANVRSAAVENLGKLRAADAVPALLDAMGVADFSWRFTILEALASIGRTVPVEKLAPLREDRLLCKALYDCLGGVGGADAVPLLIEGLSDELRTCREAAVRALFKCAETIPDTVAGNLEHSRRPELTVVLAQMLKSRDAEVRTAAAGILAWVGDIAAARELLPLFHHEGCAEQAVHALLAMGEDTVVTLVRENLGKDAALDPYLVYLAGESGCTELADFAASGLNSPEAQMRMVAARALASIGSVAHVDGLLETLSDDHEDVRAAGVFALGTLGHNHPDLVIERLLPLVEAPQALVRGCAVRVLGDIGDSSCRSALAMAFKDPVASVRQAAVYALTQSADPDMVATLALGLTDEDSEVRGLVAERLGAVGAEAAVVPLGLALGDEDIWVRVRALRSLGQIGGEGAFTMIIQELDDSVGMVVLAAVEALCEIDPVRARPYLLAALDHEDPEVIKTALQNLSRAGDGPWLSEVVEKLIDHPHWDVRLALIGMFEKHSFPDALRPRLEKRLGLEGDDLVRQAMEELLRTHEFYQAPRR